LQPPSLSAGLLREMVEDLHPEAEKVVLVTDSLNTHRTGCLFACSRPSSFADSTPPHTTAPT
jgi:hypothetical protein